MAKKLTYAFVKAAFEKEDYTLLSKEYKNSKTKLLYKCPKGHTHSISWNDWSNKGARCWYCFGTPKKSLEYIKSEFESEGYSVLISTYTGKGQKIRCVCKNGHDCLITWDSWAAGHRCSACAGLSKPTIQYISTSFYSEGYVLLSTVYINNRTKLQYLCPAGHRGEITWRDWRKGARCFECKYVKMSGSGHPNWKGGKSFEEYCQIWKDQEYKSDIRERDDNRCLNPYCTSNNPNDLTIHHIDYDKKHCHPKNLITVCRSCNSAANKNRKWHKAWYQAIMHNRYDYSYGGNTNAKN